MRTHIAIKATIVGLFFTGVLLSLLFMSMNAHSDEFNAAQTIRDAEIGTYSRGYYDPAPEDATEASEPDYEVNKSEVLYVDGKMVCYKLESGVSIAYFCNH